MNLEIDRHCFVCGPENDSGLKLTFTYGGGRAETRMTLAREQQGYTGVGHGGIIAAVLDEVMVYAAITLGHWSATAEMTIRYLKPAPLGVPLTVTGEVVRRQKRLLECRSELRDPDGTVLATATGKLLQGRAIEERDRTARSDLAALADEAEE